MQFLRSFIAKLIYLGTIKEKSNKTGGKNRKKKSFFRYLRLSKNGIHFKIGGISISGLHAGKIMFRNVIYDNGDMTIKVNDGHLLFKYWKSVEHRHLNLSTFVIPLDFAILQRKSRFFRKNYGSSTRQILAKCRKVCAYKGYCNFNFIDFL